MPLIQLPEVLDFKYYTRNNSDLRNLNESELNSHFLEFGVNEGRIGSQGALREFFLKYVHKEDSILEIGPFCNPAVKGKKVKYFDVLNEVELAKRAKEIGHVFVRPPEINYVSPVGDLSIVKESFSAIFSSHAIEHQPDLVRHLKKVSAILKPNGKYYMIIPDKRYCFDALIAESTVAGVIDAYQQKTIKHSLKSVIEHRALTTHNDSLRHWNDDHTDQGYSESIKERTSNAINEFNLANGKYIDVHAWQFTPNNFFAIMQTLFDLGLTDLKPYRVYHTPFERLEFTAVLEKS